MKSLDCARTHTFACQTDSKFSICGEESHHLVAYHHADLFLLPRYSMKHVCPLGVVSVCLFGWGGGGCWLAASQGLNCSVLLVTFFVVYFYKEKICLSLLSVFLLSATTTTTPGWGILFIFCFSPSAVHVEEHLLFLEVKCSLLCWKCSRQIHSTCVRFVDACGWCQSGQDLVQFGYKVSTNSTNVVETDTFHDSGILFIESIWR